MYNECQIHDDKSYVLGISFEVASENVSVLEDVLVFQTKERLVVVVGSKAFDAVIFLSFSG